MFSIFSKDSSIKSVRCPPPKETKTASGKSANVSTHSLGVKTSLITCVEVFVSA